jgi:hypothetical protein
MGQVRPHLAGPATPARPATTAGPAAPAGPAVLSGAAMLARVQHWFRFPLNVYLPIKVTTQLVELY